MMHSSLIPHVAEVRSATRSHRGSVRRTNQDRVLDRPEAALWAIADGMGGHEDGEAAAAMVVACLADIEHGPSGFAFLSDIVQRLQVVNKQIFEKARNSGTTSGSTLVTLIIHENHYACLWAGDSRAYVLHDGALTAITRDHSIVQDLVDHGILSEWERHNHPHRHVITRAIGTAAILQLDRAIGTVQTGDKLLLCSDGLIGCFSDAELAGQLANSDVNVIADTLLNAALDRGASDNVSLSVINILS